MYCPFCGKESNSNFCPGCGAPLKKPDNQNSNSQTSNSQYQGSQSANYQSSNSQYSYTQNQSAGPQTANPSYGNNNAYSQPTELVSEKSRWGAFLMCLFLGGIGIHRFYVGKIGTGVLYVLTIGIFGIGALVDLIMIACGTFKDIDGRVLKY